MAQSLRQLNRSARTCVRLGSAFCLVLAGFLAILHSPSAAAATFTASLDNNIVAVGGSATLTLKFEGGSPGQLPSPPGIPNLQISYAGGPMHISININGQSSSIDSYNFNVTPTQPGDYVIPPMRVEVNGQVLVSQPLKLKALKPGASSGDNAPDQLAFWKLVVPKKELFVGEVLQPQLQLFIRSGVANAEEILQRFDQVAPSMLKSDGFNVLKSSAVQHQQVQLENGANYLLTTLVSALSPVKTGSLSINLADVRVGLQIPIRQNDPMDPFGWLRHVQERTVDLPALDEKITVLPLPPGAPPGFNGAVGSYSLNVSAGPTNIAVGDPVTVKIQITGSGALDTLSLPEQPAWNTLKVYPPTTHLDSTDPLEVTGTKTFETVVIPQNTDTRSLPPVSFSYFNSDKRSYETLTGPAIGLEVRPGGSTAVPAAASARAADNPATAKDIIALKQRLGTTAQIGPPLILQSWFLAVQSLPALAFVSAVAWRKRTERLANNPRLQRRRRLSSILRQGVSDLHKAASENNSQQFFAVLVRLLQEQIGERLDLPASSITEAVLDDHLRPRGLPQSALNELRDLFQISNQVRYAPFKSSEELQAFIPKLQAVLRELQSWNA